MSSSLSERNNDDVEQSTVDVICFTREPLSMTHLAMSRITRIFADCGTIDSGQDGITHYFVSCIVTSASDCLGGVVFYPEHALFRRVIGSFKLFKEVLMC